MKLVSFQVGSFKQLKFDQNPFSGFRVLVEKKNRHEKHLFAMRDLQIVDPNRLKNICTEISHYNFIKVKV